MKRVATAALLYAIYVWYGWPAEAQPTVLSHPFEGNRWHTLDCYHDRQRSCSWEVRRGGDANSFQPVELGTPLVKMGHLPGDVQIFLNETTKGTYRCTCHLEGEQRTEHRKIVYLLSQGQRFGCIPDKVTVTKGEPLVVSVCYLPFLPEARSLKTVALVEEASRNITIALLRNFSAQFVVDDPNPGSYHFQVSTSEYGNIVSANFNVTIVDPGSAPTSSPEPTDSFDEWVVPVAIIISLIVGAPLLVAVVMLVVLCVWRRKKIPRGNRDDIGLHNVNNGGDDIPRADIAANHQGDGGLNLPLAIPVDNLQGGNNGADNLADALGVPEDLEGGGHDAGNLPLAPAGLDNHGDEENDDAELLAIPAPVNHQDRRHCAVEMEELADATEEALPPPEEEEFRERQNHQFAELCTEGSDTISVILRMPSSPRSGMYHSERMKHSLVQYLASSPTRSKTQPSVTNASLCTSVKDHLNQPKPFN